MSYLETEIRKIIITNLVFKMSLQYRLKGKEVPMQEL